MRRSTGLLGLITVLVGGCSFGSEAERTTGGHIQLPNFEVIHRTTFTQRDTFYVQLDVKASLDQLVEASRDGSLLPPQQFESVGRPSGHVLGDFVDRETGCQVLVLVTRPETPVMLTAGVVCID